MHYLAPHLPCGLVTPAQLRAFADLAERNHIGTIKISSAQRFVFASEEIDEEKELEKLGLRSGTIHAVCVRDIRTCSGKKFCSHAKQDAVALGLELDRRFFGLPLPTTVKIGVSGCALSCAESLFRDIGFIGTPSGFRLYAGGISSGNARIADPVAERLSQEEAVAVTEKIIGFIRNYPGFSPKTRLGKIIDEIGTDAFRKGIGLDRSSGYVRKFSGYVKSRPAFRISQRSGSSGCFPVLLNRPAPFVFPAHSIRILQESDNNYRR